MRIHRRNLIESIRPELVLEDWSRSDVHGDTISFGKVRNVGRGPAFRVMLNCFDQIGEAPVAVLNSTWVPLIAPGESVDIDGDIHVWWKNVAAGEDGSKHLTIRVEVSCSDRREWRYKTEYPLVATPATDNVFMSNPLVPGVLLSERRTKSVSVWWLRARTRIARIPLVGKAVKSW